jgi:hypothetical protein
MRKNTMRNVLGFGVLAGALIVLSGQPAGARFYDPSLAATPGQAQDVACRTVRSRITTSSGRVIYRTRRVCDRFGRGDCRTIRERTVRPNGSVVYRTVRRCR